MLKNRIQFIVSVGLGLLVLATSSYSRVVQIRRIDVVNGLNSHLLTSPNVRTPFEASWSVRPPVIFHFLGTRMFGHLARPADVLSGDMIAESISITQAPGQMTSKDTMPFDDLIPEASRRLQIIKDLYDSHPYLRLEAQVHLELLRKAANKIVAFDDRQNALSQLFDSRNHADDRITIPIAGPKEIATISRQWNADYTTTPPSAKYHTLRRLNFDNKIRLLHRWRLSSDIPEPEIITPDVIKELGLAEELTRELIAEFEHFHSRPLIK